MGPLLNFKDQIQRRNKREDIKKKKNQWNFPSSGEMSSVFGKAGEKGVVNTTVKISKMPPSAHPWLSLPLGQPSVESLRNILMTFPKKQDAAFRQPGLGEALL